MVKGFDSDKLAINYNGNKSVNKITLTGRRYIPMDYNPEEIMLKKNLIEN